MGNSIGIDFSPARGFHMALGAETAEMRPHATLLRRSLIGQARDASSYALLGRYDDFLGETAQKKQDDRVAAALYARQAASRNLPRAERQQALVAESRVLAEAGRGPEAEAKLRQALKRHPQAWRLWAALGEAEEDEAQARAAQTTHAGAAAQALRLDQEAQADYNQAVNLAPKQGMAYALRGDFDGDHQFLRDELRHPGHTPPLFGAAAPSVLADFQQAARLLPQSPYAIAYPVWTELSSEGFFKLHLPFPSLAAWHAMPAGVRSDTLDAIQRLTRLSHATGPVARQADVALGFLLFESQRKAAPAEAVLRRGLSGQEQEAAAEMLMHILSMGQDQALAAFCLSQAHKRNTPRLHLIAAWAEIHQGHLPQAKVQVEEAQALEPGDAADLLLLAALALKEGTLSLVEGRLLLGRASESLHTPPVNPPPDEREEHPLIHAYFLALSGDSGAAERELRSVLAVDPRNAGAANGLAILTGTPS